MKLLFFCLAFGAVNAWAQCVYSTVSVIDGGCSDFVDCSNNTGCTPTIFSVNCDSCYYLTIELSCPKSCKYCRGCAKLYNGAIQIGSDCHTQDCDGDPCAMVCDAVRFRLSSGTLYTLWACLNHCDNVECEMCEDGCRATVKLVRSSVACP